MRNVYIINAVKRASSVWNDNEIDIRVKNWWKKLKSNDSNLDNIRY